MLHLTGLADRQQSPEQSQWCTSALMYVCVYVIPCQLTCTSDISLCFTFKSGFLNVKENKYFQHLFLSKYEGILFPCKKKERTNKVSVCKCMSILLTHQVMVGGKELTFEYLI